MWLNELAEYARSKNIEKLGQGVFVHTMPHDVSHCAMFASGYTGMPIDKEIPSYFRGPMQVIARAKSIKDVESIATALSEALTMHEREVGTIYVNSLEPRHLPAVFPRSNGDFYEASVNFDICFVAL